MKLNHQKALLLFSGGQDSAICLAWALSRFEEVETIGFDYGQRHNVELQARQNVRSKVQELNETWGEKLGEDHLIDFSALGEISETAMTRDVEITMDASDLPNTFVPGRNLLFFNLAGALAYRRGIGSLIGGMCEADYSGYPDCREDTLQALLKSMNMGMATDFQIETPLMHLTKAQSWALAKELGGQELVQIVREESHTCYLGERGKLHDWGYGCGTCPACELRAKGWQEYREAF